MDRSQALRELPTVHAVALRLRDNGFGDEVIAAVLDVEHVQVAALLRIAEAKLAKLLRPSSRRLSSSSQKLSSDY